MTTTSYKHYNSFIFDFDGVILDSNNIKKAAIREAVQGVLSSKKAEEFVSYFVGLNGIPREEKIATYVPKEKYEFVLNKYEHIIDKELENAKLIPGVKSFIKSLSKLQKNMIVLSGGTQTEVLQLLKDKGIAKDFKGVYGGPKNKEENLKKVTLERPVLYFGDSEVDYMVSKNNNFDFIFVYGTSNMLNWKSRVKDWKLAGLIMDFSNKGQGK